MLMMMILFCFCARKQIFFASQ